LTPEEMTFALAALSLIAGTLIGLAKIYFLHIPADVPAVTPKS